MKNEVMSHDPCPAVKFAVTNLFFKTRIQYRKITTWSTEKKHFLATLKYLEDYLTCFCTFQHQLQIASNDVPAFRFPPSGWHWPIDVPSSCHRSVCNTLGQRLHNCRNAEQPVKGGDLKTETTKNTRIEETTLHVFYCSSSMCLGLFFHGQPDDSLEVSASKVNTDLTETHQSQTRKSLEGLLFMVVRFINTWDVPVSR